MSGNQFYFGNQQNPEAYLIAPPSWRWCIQKRMFFVVCNNFSAFWAWKSNLAGSSRGWSKFNDLMKSKPKGARCPNSQSDADQKVKQRRSFTFPSNPDAVDSGLLRVIEERKREKDLNQSSFSHLNTEVQEGHTEKNEPKGNYTRVCKAESVSEATEEVDASVKVIRTFCCEGK